VPELHLTKLHATGNDFLVLADLAGAFGPRRSPNLPAALRAALCDRRRGVGADGFIRLLPGSGGADCAMELANADGGWAEVSGNGLRCLAHVAVRLGLGQDRRLVVDSEAGRHHMEVVLRQGEVVWASADMGAVTFTPAEIPLEANEAFDLVAEVDGVTYRGDAAGTGNPHFVVLVDDPLAVPLDRHGPVLEHDPRFPRRTNVEVVAAGSNGLRMRVWERGVGETASCGSGACAAAAVAQRRGLVGERTVVAVAGGELEVELGATVRLGGPVARVFDVDVDLDRLAASVGEVAP
jgi:diaminopimelate epimerase